MKVVAYIFLDCVAFTEVDGLERSGNIPHDGTLLGVANAIDTLQTHADVELRFSASMNVANHGKADAPIEWFEKVK